LNGLLKGLEISILPLSEALNENETKRIDPEYFNKSAVEVFRRLKNGPRLGEFVKEGYRVVYENTKIVDREEGLAANYPLFLQSADITTPFINQDSMACVHDVDWHRYPKGRIKAGELLIEVKGKAEKIAVVPDDFPMRTLVTGTCYKLSTHKKWQRSLLLTHLLGHHGTTLKNRLKTNLLVAYIAKNDLYRIPTPNFSESFALKVHELVENSLNARNSILLHQEKAESVLLTSLGLSHWAPPEPLTYTARASDVFLSKRIDAQFFAPCIQALLDLLSVTGRTLADVAEPRREKFRAHDCTEFNYIEIGDIDNAGSVGSTRMAADEAPSRAAWHVRADDIITSTIRPIRRLSAQIKPEQDGFVCSSGFIVVISRQIAPEVLLTYLRLPVICHLLDLHSSASMYPAITEADIFNLPLPEIPNETSTHIIQNARAAKTAKTRASHLLNTAKHAVELAIEHGEPTALDWLEQTTQELS